MGGVGGTLAGNPLSMAAARAMPRRGAHRRGVRAHDRARPPARRARCARPSPRHGLPWSVTQLGARAEYRFADPAPRNGTESDAAADAELDDYLHVFAANRGVLLTPFHNMALMCPATTEADVDTYAEVFAARGRRRSCADQISGPQTRVPPDQRALRSGCRGGAPRSAAPRRTVTSRPSSALSDVTPASRMPHGTIVSYADRSQSQLRAKPCRVTPRATRIPIAATLRSGPRSSAGTQTPLRPSPWTRVVATPGRRRRR